MNSKKGKVLYDEKKTFHGFKNILGREAHSSEIRALDGDKKIILREEHSGGKITLVRKEPSRER